MAVFYVLLADVVVEVPVPDCKLKMELHLFEFICPIAKA